MINFLSKQLHFFRKFRLPNGLIALILLFTLSLLGSFGVNQEYAVSQIAKPEAVRIDYAYYNPVSLVLKQKGWLEESLKKDNIKVEWVLSQGSNKALEFLNARSLDFGSTAGAAALIGKANGNPIQSIYVFSKPEWAALVVKKGSPIKSVKDLKGKKIAATKGTDPYIFLLRALDKFGLTTKDVEIVLLQHADGRAALEKGDVDAWAGLDPHMAKTEVENGSRLFFREPNLNSYGVLNVREEFSQKYPNTVKKVLIAYEKARKWSLQNKAQLQDVLEKESKLSPAVAAKQLERTNLKDSRIGDAQKKVIIASGNVLKKSGVIPNSVDVPKTTNSLINPQYRNSI
jgi:sulfonate transport system substrate-binding protein